MRVRTLRGHCRAVERTTQATPPAPPEIAWRTPVTRPSVGDMTTTWQPIAAASTSAPQLTPDGATHPQVEVTVTRGSHLHVHLATLGPAGDVPEARLTAAEARNLGAALVAAATGVEATLCATLLLREGASVHLVARMLGHRDPSITLQVYSHAIPGDDSGLAHQLADILKERSDSRRIDSTGWASTVLDGATLSLVHCSHGGTNPGPTHHGRPRLADGQTHA